MGKSEDYKKGYADGVHSATGTLCRKVAKFRPIEGTAKGRCDACQQLVNALDSYCRRCGARLEL